MKYHRSLENEKGDETFCFSVTIYFDHSRVTYILMKIFNSSALAITPFGFKLSYTYLIMCIEKNNLFFTIIYKHCFFTLFVVVSNVSLWYNYRLYIDHLFNLFEMKMK